MTRTVFRGGSVFDGTGADPAPADVAVEDGRIVDVGDGPGRRRGRGGRWPDAPPGPVRLPRPRRVQPRRRLEDGEHPVLVPLLRGGAEPARHAARRHHVVRDAGGADLGVKQARETGSSPGRGCRSASRWSARPAATATTGSCRASGCRSSRTTPGMPSGIVDGPDEMRRKVRELHAMGADVIKVATSGGVLSPRDDPRHAHFRPAELDVLVEEATAAGHVRDGPRPGRATASGTRSGRASAPSSTASSSTTRAST